MGKQGNRTVVRMQAGETGYVRPSAIVRTKPTEGLILVSAVLMPDADEIYNVFVEYLQDGEITVTCTAAAEMRFSHRDFNTTYFPITLPSRP